MRNVLLLVLAVSLAACGTLDYKPVEASSLEDLMVSGCLGKQDRINATAKVNAAFKETVVLWDGVDSTRTLAVRLPKEGFGSKARGLVGQSKFDVNLEALRRLQADGSEAQVALRCEGKDRAPILIRVRYMEDGIEREIELGK